jgi:hypothetical protein
VPERSERLDAVALGCPYPRVDAVGVALAAGRAAAEVDVGRAVLTFARFTLLILFTFLERSTLMFTSLWVGAYTFLGA